MVPFRVYDRKSKQMWQIIHHNQGVDGGAYLASREDETEEDGDMMLIQATELVGFKFVEFIEETEALD